MVVVCCLVYTPKVNLSPIPAAINCLIEGVQTQVVVLGKSFR